MFEKIGWYAETVATSGGQSRRGFLGQLGQAALGVAGVVGGLLLMPGEARASNYCVYRCPDGSLFIRDCPCRTSIKHAGMTCAILYIRCGY
jgi:hypothetical protein